MTYWFTPAPTPAYQSVVIRLTGRRLDIAQNLFRAFAYNTVPIPVAAAGLLSPVLAGAAMGVSSATVVTNSLRLTAYRRRRPTAPHPLLNP